MRHLDLSLATGLVLLAALANPGRAQAPRSANDTPLDPAAMTALTNMGAYLRSLKVFQIEAELTDEDVLNDGQKVQYIGQASLLARPPGQLRAVVSNDLHERLYLYDGKTFTLFAPRLNYYATAPAPPTIPELADNLQENHGFDLPLVDLFRWGSRGVGTKGITAAADIGPSNVEGTTCEHYIYREKDIDWQIWIQKGDYPLPRRLVITTKTDEARPQHTAVYTWNLAPSFNDRAFKFEPPPGATRVKLANDSLTSPKTK